MENTYYLIDANALCYKAHHTLGELNHDTIKVGVIFGFFGQLIKISKTFGDGCFAFFWDSNISYRRQLYPDYKRNRLEARQNKTPEEKEIDKQMYHQFDILYNDIIPTLGFTNNHREKGIEGDDLIASSVDNSEPEDQLYIVSGDEDMYQCLCPGVDIIKNYKTYTKEDFEIEWGIHPKYWWEVKSIAGCKTDNVSGVVGVAEKTAIKYLNHELPFTSKKYNSIHGAQGRAIKNRNKPLVQLPFSGTPPITLVPYESIDLMAWIRICQRYDFQYYLQDENIKRFKKLLRMV